MADPLHLRTHTSLWRIERRLYKIYDLNLPVPISLRQLVVAIVVGLPWLVLMRVLGVPFAPPFGHLLWLVPPAAAAWYANRPVAEGKTFVELIISQVRYVAQARHYARLRPFVPNRRARVHVRLWHRGTTPARATWQPREAAPSLSLISARGTGPHPS